MRPDPLVPVWALSDAYRALAGLELCQQEAVCRCLLTLCRQDEQAIQQALAELCGQNERWQAQEPPGGSGTRSPMQ